MAEGVAAIVDDSFTHCFEVTHYHKHRSCAMPLAHKPCFTGEPTAALELEHLPLPHVASRHCHSLLHPLPSSVRVVHASCCLILDTHTHTTHNTHQNRLLVLILGSLIFFICFPLCRLVHHTPLLPSLLLFTTLLSHIWHLHRSAKGALASLGSRGITCSHPSFIAPH